MTTSRAVCMIIVMIISLPYHQASNIFESLIHLTPMGNAYEPRYSIELLKLLGNMKSLLHCSMFCNQDPRCRTFDFDQSTKICRLFESDFSTGNLVSNASTLLARVGAMRYDTDRVMQTYASFNKTCNQSDVADNRYLQCSLNRFQCPSLTFWNGQQCMNQLHRGSNCNASTDCRTDLNLTCSNQNHKCITTSGKIDQVSSADKIKYQYILSHAQ
jgi:hypothetical protein